jgi:hypothetical protein
MLALLLFLLIACIDLKDPTQIFILRNLVKKKNEEFNQHGV